jgi:hydrophobic/amphiphilic exporter-1 (mainly G- bacteria), HAE1 family
MWISNTSIRQPVFTTMVISALIVFGAVAYWQLGIDLFPKIDFPIITITTVLPGADPETMETDVTERIEEAVNTINGVKSLRSQSSESVSIVVVEFELDRDVDVASQDVRDKISSTRANLPTEIEEPVIQKLDPDSMPILAVALSGNRPIREITDYADDVIKERLERISGVGSVEIVGGREREIRIWLQADRLIAYQLGVDEVAMAIRTENLEVPGGRIETGPRELVVRTRGRMQRPDQFGNIVVADRPSGPIYLRDVALVEDGMADERSLSRLNGERAVSLLIRRQSGTNTVQVAHLAKAALEDLRQKLPPGYTMILADDTSKFIEESIGDVKFDLLFGGFLAVAVIFLFLRNVTSTMISAVAIPTSILGTFTFISALGFTVNFMTMLALSLSVGMLIDDAIVVIENVFRHMEEGLHRRESAEYGTSEIGLAVMATTFTIVAVFVPVAFMHGIIGRFFYQFGMTVACAVLISLFVSFTLTPMLSSRILTMPARHSAVYRAIEAALNGLDRNYRGLLGWALRHRLVIVGLATLFFVSSLYMLRFVGAEFLPQDDESQFSVTLRTDPGSSLQATDAVVQRVEGMLRKNPYVRDLFTTIGGGAQERVTDATIVVKLPEPNERPLTQQQIMDQVRESLKTVADARVSVEAVERMSAGGGRQGTLQVSVQGPKTAPLSQLANLTDRLVDGLRQTPGIVDLDTTFEGGKPQASVAIDRARAADLGISAAQLGSAVRLLVGGDKVSEYQEGGKQFDVRVRLPETDRNDPVKIDQLVLRSRSGGVVQLGNVARIVRDTGPTEIDHLARQRQIMINANLQGKPLGAAVEDVNALARRIGFPEGFTYSLEGQAQIMAESFADLTFALLLAVILVYMVLASQFGSFLHPFTIMLSLPMSLVGAIGGLLLTGSVFSILAMIGIIMLMGLVTKNAILLVDYTNTLRQRDRLERNQALLQAGPVRLRPILMTTSAMVFGMMPVALGLGSGGQSRAPMAITVIGGLLTSTLLTLVVVPVVYTLLDDLSGIRVRDWVPGLRRGAVRRPALGEVEAGTGGGDR